MSNVSPTSLSSRSELEASPARMRARSRSRSPKLAAVGPVSPTDSDRQDPAPTSTQMASKSPATSTMTSQDSPTTGGRGYTASTEAAVATHELLKVVQKLSSGEPSQAPRVHQHLEGCRYGTMFAAHLAGLTENRAYDDEELNDVRKVVRFMSGFQMQFDVTMDEWHRNIQEDRSSFGVDWAGE